MGLFDIAALARRHAIALTALLIVIAITGFTLLHAKSMYNDTTTVDFKTTANPFVEAGALIVTSDMMARSMMSPESQQLVRQAGGSVGYQVDLVNLYNLEYPNYSVPYVTVSVTSGDPVAVENTFNAVLRVLTDELRSWQAGQGIPSINQIELYTLSGSKGVVSLSGSPMRSMAALLVLTIIALFLVAAFLDKHQIWLRRFRAPGLWRL
jgi:hypothetical protein